MKKIDLTGNRYDHLTVVKENGRRAFETPVEIEIVKSGKVFIYES